MGNEKDLIMIIIIKEDQDQDLLIKKEDNDHLDQDLLIEKGPIMIEKDLDQDLWKENQIIELKIIMEDDQELLLIGITDLDLVKDKNQTKIIIEGDHDHENKTK